MKLLNITNRYYIIIALVLLLVSSAFLAYRVVYIVDNDVSEHMLFEKLEIEKQIALQKDLQDLHFIIGDRLEIEPIGKRAPYLGRKFPSINDAKSVDQGLYDSLKAASNQP